MTFINEGNPNYVEKLVNFEKMVSLRSPPLPTLSETDLSVFAADDRQDGEGGARVQKSALQ